VIACMTIQYDNCVKRAIQLGALPIELPKPPQTAG
jgi:hypothetical protein